MRLETIMKSEQKESPRAKLEHLYSKMFFSENPKAKNVNKGLDHTEQSNTIRGTPAYKIRSHHLACFLSSDNCVFHATGSELIVWNCQRLTHIEVESFAFPNICFCLHRFSVYLVNRTRNSLNLHINCLHFLKMPAYD